MKKFTFFLMLFSFLIISKSRAGTFTVNVNDNFFEPSVLTLVVGDVVMFQWKEGTHTTTSDTVPAGAQMWDAPITSTNETFMYTVTVPGHYHYFCTVHGQMMSGVIEASNLTGILPIQQMDPSISINSFNKSNISIHYQLPNAVSTTINLYDLAGNKSLTVVDGLLPSGDYVQEYRLNKELIPGVYFITIASGNLKLTRKIGIQ